MARGKSKTPKVGGPLPSPTNGDGPGIGHNNGDLTDDQKQVLWFEHRRKIVTLRGKMETVKADLRNQYKTLKADLGFTKADVDFALRLTNDDKLLEEEKRRRTLARWEGSPIGTQLDIFDTDRTPAVDRAFAEGKRAGLAGDPCKPSYAPELEQYGEYMRGFHDGQAVLAKGIKPTERNSDEYLQQEDTVTRAIEGLRRSVNRVISE